MRAIVSAAAILLVAASAPNPRAQGLEVPAISWRQSAAGVERAVFDVSGGGEGWRTRVIAVRLDPSRVRFRLRARLRDLTPAWNVERAPAAAVVAVNAGQFVGTGPGAGSSWTARRCGRRGEVRCQLLSRGIAPDAFAGWTISATPSRGLASSRPSSRIRH